jgi:hypothetical protein
MSAKSFRRVRLHIRDVSERRRSMQFLHVPSLVAAVALIRDGPDVLGLRAMHDKL